MNEFWFFSAKFVCSLCKERFETPQQLADHKDDVHSKFKLQRQFLGIFLERNAQTWLWECFLKSHNLFWMHFSDYRVYEP